MLKKGNVEGEKALLEDTLCFLKISHRGGRRNPSLEHYEKNIFWKGTIKKNAKGLKCGGILC